MANNKKQGFFSTLFGKRKPTEEEEIAEQESRQRLEERIQRALAERAVVPALLMAEENQSEVAPQEEEAELPVELLPISASVIPIRKAPAQSAFVLAAFETPRSYASSQRG
jgi:hypothetical protein